METGFEKLVADAKKNITEILPTGAAEKIKSDDAVIVDVREKDEWDEGQILAFASVRFRVARCR